ncbi:MAG TPA: hypothetical protein VHK26_05510 [Methyloceanibacter sp.]|jgi:hypothetical protein|nr:hypothetical protein [Methyloceanibacter sp.]
MDLIRAQIREVADVQIAAAVKDLTDRIDAKVAAIQVSAPQVEAPPKQEEAATESSPDAGGTKRPTTWPWSIIL